MVDKENLTLAQQISTACPRATMGLIDYENGSLEVVFTNNLRRMNMRPFTTEFGGQKVHYYAEVDNPAIFLEQSTLRVQDRANYTIIRHTDHSGQAWTIEAFHPKFQNHELGINRSQGNRTDRFIYAYSETTGKLFLSKVALSLRDNKDNRFSHDTVSIRLTEDGILENVRIRINQNTSFKPDPALKVRAKSQTYGHIHQFDDSTVLNTYVDIGTKIVFGKFQVPSHEQNRFEDYISILETIGDYYEVSITSDCIVRIKPILSEHLHAIVDSIVMKDGIISLCSGLKILLSINLNKLIAFDASSLLNPKPNMSDLERLYQFGQQQIDSVLMKGTDKVFVKP